MNGNENRYLGEEPVGSLMQKYAIPCIISLLVGALYNIVDQIFIANASYLGSYGNAANTVVFPLTVIALAIAVMIGDGCCAFVSLSLGKQEIDRAKKSVGNSIVLMILSSLILMASGARSALVTADMVCPGMTIIGMEGFRDIDPRIGKLADKWYLGYRKPDAHILKSPMLNPAFYLEEKDVFSDMTMLLTGEAPGREKEREVIVSTHMGMGAHDVSCAATVYERALKEGRGRRFILDPQ